MGACRGGVKENPEKFFAHVVRRMSYAGGRSRSGPVRREGKEGGRRRGGDGTAGPHGVRHTSRPLPARREAGCPSASVVRRGGYSRTRLSRSAFETTETEEKLIAAAAMIGLSSSPVQG